MKRSSRKKSLSQYKKKLDAIFSKYVRLAHADTIGLVSCFTCGKLLPWQQSQCGHFVSRQYLATRWEVDNCRPQCVGCNVWGSGKLFDFEERLEQELGTKRLNQLKQSRHNVCKLDEDWYRRMISSYTRSVEEVRDQLGL